MPIRTSVFICQPSEGNTVTLLQFHTVLSAPVSISVRAHIAYMVTALYAIASPSICLSVKWVDQSKTVAVRIMQFSPYGSHIPLIFAGFHLGILMGSPPRGDIKQGRGEKNEPFSSFKRQYLENGSRYGQSYY